MELLLQQKMIPYLRRTARGTAYQEENTETIVPDSYPDVESITDSYAYAMLRSKECRDGSLMLTGSINGAILYQPEDHSVPRKLDLYLPFSMKVEQPSVNSHSRVVCDVRVCAVDARILNSRKVTAAIRLGCQYQTFEKAEEIMYTQAEQVPGLETKHSVYLVSLPLETAEKIFSMQETVSPEAGRPKIDRLYKVYPTAQVQDQKLIGNRAVFKGTINCKILYFSEENLPVVWNCQLPFSQFCDLERDYEEELLHAMPVVSGCVVEQTEDGQLSVTLQMLVQCLVYGTEPLDVIEDAYCTKGTLNGDWKDFQLESSLDQQKLMTSVRKTVSSPIRKLVDSELYWDYPCMEQQDDQTKIIVPVKMSGFGTDGEDNYTGVSGRMEATAEIPLAREAKCAANVSEVSTATVPVPDGLELRCELNLETRCTAQQNFHVLCGGNIEPDSEETARKPSVIIRSAREGDSLWDLAKACRTTVQLVQSVNHLEGDIALESGMLIIPICDA